MGPKINGLNMAELVAKEVSRQLALNVKNNEKQLLVAMSRIASLEEEIALCLQNSNNSSIISKSNSQSVSPRTSSSDVCRHWQRNRCTWTNCRFRHGGATPTPSLSDFNAKDSEEEAPYAKEKVDKSVQVEFLLDCTSSPASTCEIPMESSDTVGCPLNSSLHSRPWSFSGVLQPELVGAALSNSVADSLLDDLLESVIASSVDKKPAPVVNVIKFTSPVTGPCMPVSKEEIWLED